MQDVLQLKIALNKTCLLKYATSLWCKTFILPCSLWLLLAGASLSHPPVVVGWRARTAPPPVSQCASFHGQKRLSNSDSAKQKHMCNLKAGVVVRWVEGGGRGWTVVVVVVGEEISRVDARASVAATECEMMTHCGRLLLSQFLLPARPAGRAPVWEQLRLWVSCSAPPVKTSSDPTRILLSAPLARLMSVFHMTSK